MQAILSRQENVDEIAEELIEHWRYDLYTRRPGPALLADGVLIPTDLDLACFMSALVDRKAVINLPTYQSRRASTTKASERVVSKENRHGNCHGLTSNKECFSFGVTIKDFNVIVSNETEGDSVGAFRTFMLVDVDGSWHDGWGCIEFHPTAKENDFLNDKSLWTGHTVYFKNFVHPNRWSSFYGQYYFLTKIMIDRLEEEATFLRKHVKELRAAGVQYPPSAGDVKPAEYEKTERGEAVSIKVVAFQAEVDVPWTGEFRWNPQGNPQEDLVAASRRLKKIQYGMLPHLRFAARATEYAFSKIGANNHSFPGWIKGAEWQADYVQPGKKIKWFRLVLNQLYPWTKGFAIRFRYYEKSERVAA